MSTKANRNQDQRVRDLEDALMAARGYTVNRRGYPRPITRRIDKLLGLPADIDTKHKRRARA